MARTEQHLDLMLHECSHMRKHGHCDSSFKLDVQIGAIERSIKEAIEIIEDMNDIWIPETE